MIRPFMVEALLKYLTSQTLGNQIIAERPSSEIQRIILDS